MHYRCQAGTLLGDQEKENKEREQPNAGRSAHTAITASKTMILLGPKAKAKTPHSAASKLGQSSMVSRDSCGSLSKPVEKCGSRRYS